MQTDERDLVVAWNCIIQQYIGLAARNALEEGPGLNIFRMLPRYKRDLYNCEYMYTEKGGKVWNEYMTRYPYSRQLLEKYDDASMFIVAVQVSTEDGRDIVGGLRLFDVITRNQLEFVDESS